jgi:hypothetical protein
MSPWLRAYCGSPPLMIESPRDQGDSLTAVSITTQYLDPWNSSHSSSESHTCLNASSSFSSTSSAGSGLRLRSLHVFRVCGETRGETLRSGAQLHCFARTYLGPGLKLRWFEQPYRMKVMSLLGTVQYVVQRMEIATFQAREDFQPRTRMRRQDIF